MKRSDNKSEQDYQHNTEEEPEIVGESIPDKSEVNSIQEFIELKKLQNRILGKMIEKLNTNENQNKPNNK